MSILFFVVDKIDSQAIRKENQERITGIIRHLLPDSFSDYAAQNVSDSDGCLSFQPSGSSYIKLDHDMIFNAFGPVTELPPDRICPPNAAFRFFNDAGETAISTNLVASRSVWYFFDADQLIVSTSQRAIICYLGSFQLNRQAMSWMLSSGNMGPGNSWDTRIKHLKPSETIRLEKASWKLRSYTRNNSAPVSYFKNEDIALTELNNVFSKVFNWSSQVNKIDKTVLTLSGGYDSRTVLYNFLSKGLKVPTVTWGLSTAYTEYGTDASVAAALAAELKVENRFFETDFRERTFEPLLNHFLAYGEGRLDHINSFMDGFRMWDQLYREGIRNVVRADEVFGWLPSNNEQDVRISLDFHHMEDNSNMIPLHYFDLEPQRYPDELLRHPEESLDTWRDRLYREFRLPYVLTGLHDLIQPYMDVVDPLLHDDFIGFVKKLPDHLRTGKTLYIRYARSLMNDNVPLAIKASIPEPSSILRSARIVSLMLDELSSQTSRNVVNSKLIQWIQDHLRVDDSLVNSTNNTLAAWIKLHTPWQIKKVLRRDLIKYKADFNQLAFRLVIISRINKLFADDAGIFNRSRLVRV